MEIAVQRDGKLLALRAHRTVDQGAYPKAPFPASIVTSGVRDLLPGPYRWEAYAYSSTVVATNKCTYVSYRGPWAVETWARERALDEVAREIGMDPAELRYRNVIDGGPDDRSITGRTLAGISTRPSIIRALELVDYETIRGQQRAGAPRRSRLGVGFATFLEAAPGPPEFRAGGGPFGGEQAKAKLEADGRLTVTTAQTPGGQGLETTLAQVAADEFGLELEHVTIAHGDTSMTPFKLIGTGGSMSSSWASGAVRLATRRVKEKVLALAASMLEVSEADLEITGGHVVPRGVPTRAVPIAELARQVAYAPFSLPSGVDRVLEAHEAFVGEQITGSGWSGGTHTCVVEVDLDTGKVHILRYVVVEDCGRVINPAIVEGQVRGAVAQAIGEVFYEHAAYDEHGNFLATTFMDYLIPAAAEVPPIEVEHLETDPEGEFGFRGVGEGGLIVAPAALTNAVADALAPLGARVFEQYLPPHRILELAGVIDVAS
jgi:carbon-monoxide dehydrogenase large subunit